MTACHLTRCLIPGQNLLLLQRTQSPLWTTLIVALRIRTLEGEVVVLLVALLLLEVVVGKVSISTPASLRQGFPQGRWLIFRVVALLRIGVVRVRYMPRWFPVE